MVEPLSIYIHVPFCTKKCGYCQFAVVPYQERFKEPYLSALIKEIKAAHPIFSQHKIVSIYFGGGTPSLLSADDIGRVLEAFTDHDGEITLEANPESIDLLQLQMVKKYGVNRLSLGVQSFDDKELLQLTRLHTSREIVSAIDTIVDSGIKNISIDLMYDLFDQNLEKFQKTLEKATSFPITHLSLYNLVIEPFTSFFKQKKMDLQPNEQMSTQLHHLAIHHLEKEGFARYEISAFCKEGFVSLHNIGYWQGRSLLGFGPSAWSYYEGKRFRKTQLFQRWMKQVHLQQPAIDFEEKLEGRAAFNERLAIALRMVEGVEVTEKILQKKEIAHLITEGFLRTTTNRIQLTEKGLLFYDTVAARII